jgi:hypothetical protein
MLKRDENVTFVACCNPSGAFSPIFISKNIYVRKIYKQDLTAESEVAVADSASINGDIFLQWLQHFHHRSPGKCLLLWDWNSSLPSMMCSNYCKESESEMLCLQTAPRQNCVQTHRLHAHQP